ncbi:MAG TPA: DedA family protein [Blastocatellia bacterium]|nr:DedA family protein [Blastocatellia bacterium]
MTDQLLGLLALYGVPAFFGIILVSSVGVPFPITLLLVVAGSFVSQGEMKLWEVIVFGSAGAVLGDQIGYWIGRRGGRELVQRLTHRFGGASKIARAEALNRQWGGAAVFFSRCLATPLGPWVNLACGISEYSWLRFLLWDALGECIWVITYVTLGRVFSDRVQALAELLGNLGWAIVGLILCLGLGWSVLHYFRRPAEPLQE